MLGAQRGARTRPTDHNLGRASGSPCSLVDKLFNLLDAVCGLVPVNNGVAIWANGAQVTDWIDFVLLAYLRQFTHMMNMDKAFLRTYLQANRALRADG